MVGASASGAERPAPGPPSRLIGRPTWRWFDVRRWGRRRVGIVAVLVVYAALGTANAFIVRPLLPRDEVGHISYVVSITHGKLPDIYTPLAKADVPQMRKNHKDTTWVANHPPLFYVLGAVPMKFALALHKPTLGIRLIRLMNVGLVMVTMVLAAVLARRLLWRSSRAPLVAAATTGLIATVPHTAAMAYNDALAMATAAALMVAAVALFDRGPNRHTVAWVAGCASAAALTRFTNFAVIGPVGVVVAIGVWRHAAGSVVQRAAAVLRGGVAIGVPVALASGWFYLRNKRLYGDFTGAHDLLVMFNRHASGTARGYLTSEKFWEFIHDGLWSRYVRAATNQTYGHGLPIGVGRILTLVMVVGLLCGAARLARYLAASARRPHDRHWPPELTLGLAALLQIAVMLVMVAQFQSGGGSAHSRYLFPLLPVMGCFTALAWACLPGNRRGVLSVLAFGAAVGVAVNMLHRFGVIFVGDRGWGHTEIDGLRAAVPAPAAVLAGLTTVLVVAGAVACWVLLTLPAERLLRRPDRLGTPPGAAPEPAPDPSIQPTPPAVDGRTGVRHEVGPVR